MRLKRLTPEAYDALRKDISENENNYLPDTGDWLQQYFSDKGIENFCEDTTITVAGVQLTVSGSDDNTKCIDDLNNTRQIYSAYKDALTPLQATDHLMWTALSHMEYSDYIIKRWGHDDGNVNVGKRFFATGARNSLCYYNAISRFWWSGYLTYEEEKSSTNPWKVTEVLFSAQQIQKDLFDQPYSMNKTVVKGLLKALGKIQSERGNKATMVFRKCCDSFLNHYGAVTVLDFLTAEDIYELAYNYMHEQK